MNKARKKHKYIVRVPYYARTDNSKLKKGVLDTVAPNHHD